MRVVMSGCAMLLLVAWAAPAARGETIYLNGGTVLRGRIASRDADKLVLDVEQDGGRATVTIPLARVRRIGPDGETATAMADAGLVLLKSGDPDAAAERFEDALAADPKHPRALAGRSLVIAAKGDYAGAAAQLRRSLLLAPTDPELRYHLGMTLVRAGDPSAALDAFERALALGPAPELVESIRTQLGRLRALAAQPRVDQTQAAARAGFDAELGNNASAAAAGKVCLDQLKALTRTLPGFDGDIFVELKAPPPEEQLFAAGGDAARYQTSVGVAQISFLVSPRSWSLLSNREKREIIGSWIRYLKDLYPYATSIAVVSDGTSYLVEAAWNDIQNDIAYHWHRSRDAHR